MTVGPGLGQLPVIVVGPGLGLPPMVIVGPGLDLPPVMMGPGHGLVVGPGFGPGHHQGVSSHGGFGPGGLMMGPG